MLVSRASGVSGAKGFGSDQGSPLDVSPDGRFVVFLSKSTTLHPDDTDATHDVFVRDLEANTTTLVSRAGGASGAKQNGDSYEASISRDGTRVAFMSVATNLHPDDTDAVQDIFVRDLTTNTTVLVSRATGATGSKSNGLSDSPSISADGGRVVFTSLGSNLHPDDNDATSDIFVRDLTSATTTLVSRATGASGAKANNPSFLPSIDGDGSRVSFTSIGTNLDPADSEPLYDVYVRDLAANTTMLVSRASGATGAKGNSDSYNNDISTDGGFVAFSTFANNLDTADGSAVWDVYVRNLTTNATELISRPTGTSGSTANESSHAASLSADGTKVAFLSSADDLHPDDTDTLFDVFLRDRATQTTLLVSRASGSGGAKGNAHSTSAGTALSDDGAVVGFETLATNIHPDDMDAIADVYVRVLATGVRSTSTTLACTPGSASLGSQTTCTATINDTGAGTKSVPTGTVSFTSNSAGTFSNPGNSCSLGATENPGQASCQVTYTPTSLGSGSHAITAAYGGDSSHTQSSGNASLPIVPAPPVLTDTDPDSPADNNNPRIKGTAAPSTTIRIYASADCTGSPLAIGSSAAFTGSGIQISVLNNSTTTLRATAQDFNGTSACSSSSITYVEATPPAADLNVTKTANVSSTSIGSFVTYTITVTNLGPSTAPDARVSDVIPQGRASSLTSSSSQGPACAHSVDESRTAVSCDLGQLVSGGSASVTVKHAVVGGGPLTNTVTAGSASIPDPNSANNSASATVNVINPTTCTLSGTQLSNNLSGTAGVDYICGLGGDDSIAGGASSDTILAGDGDDTLEYEYPFDVRGNDVLDGGPGTWDYVYYRDAPSAVAANLASGLVSGGAGADQIRGVEGVVGSPWADVITGGAVGEAFWGDQGNDTLTGAGGSDDIDGEEGNDIIYARDGVLDYIYGGPGTDRAQVDSRDVLVDGGIEGFF